MPQVIPVTDVRRLFLATHHPARPANTQGESLLALSQQLPAVPLRP